MEYDGQRSNSPNVGVHTVSAAISDTLKELHAPNPQALRLFSQPPRTHRPMVPSRPNCPFWVCGRLMSRGASIYCTYGTPGYQRGVLLPAENVRRASSI